jgi:hypothetical protein
MSNLIAGTVAIPTEQPINRLSEQADRFYILESRNRKIPVNKARIAAKVYVFKSGVIGKNNVAIRCNRTFNTGLGRLEHS